MRAKYNGCTCFVASLFVIEIASWARWQPARWHPARLPNWWNGVHECDCALVDLMRELSSLTQRLNLIYSKTSILPSLLFNIINQIFARQHQSDSIANCNISPPLHHPLELPLNINQIFARQHQSNSGSAATFSYRNNAIQSVRRESAHPRRHLPQ